MRLQATLHRCRVDFQLRSKSGGKYDLGFMKRPVMHEHHELKWIVPDLP